ncbi:hypothetical protein [Amycolatopsis sp. WAC 04182]|nr:hypothetical protein [Amycolatopsis sp. WAC 04182]
MPTAGARTADTRDQVDNTRDWMDDTRDPADDSRTAEVRREPSV